LKLAGVWNEAPDSCELCQCQRRDPRRVFARPLNGRIPQPPIQPILEKTPRISARLGIGGSLLGHEATDERHVACAGRRWADSVVQTSADLQRRGNESARNAVIANPPGGHRYAQTNEHERYDRHLPTAIMPCNQP